MNEVVAMNEAYERIKSLPPEYCYDLMRRLMEEEIVNIPSLIAVYAQHLQDFKNDAVHDMYLLSEAGITLAGTSIKKIPSIQDVRKREVQTAMANTLLTNRTSSNESEYVKGLRKYVDMGIVDKGWYEQCWALRTNKIQPTGGKVDE